MKRLDQRGLGHHRHSHAPGELLLLLRPRDARGAQRVLVVFGIKRKRRRLRARLSHLLIALLGATQLALEVGGLQLQPGPAPRNVRTITVIFPQHIAARGNASNERVRMFIIKLLVIIKTKYAGYKCARANPIQSAQVTLQ